VYIAKREREKAIEAESGGKSGEEADSGVENNKEITIDKVIEKKENRSKREADSDDADDADNANNIIRQSKDAIIADPIKDYYKLTKFTMEQECLI
jgi:hypothetical protein